MLTDLGFVAATVRLVELVGSNNDILDVTTQYDVGVTTERCFESGNCCDLSGDVLDELAFYMSESLGVFDMT